MGTRYCMAPDWAHALAMPRTGRATFQMRCARGKQDVDIVPRPCTDDFPNLVMKSKYW